MANWEFYVRIYNFFLFINKKTKLDWVPLGKFDHTLEKNGFVPKEVLPKEIHKISYFDRDYYEKLCQSKFVLTPAGDAPWSMRFYEALMTKAVPIVK